MPQEVDGPIPAGLSAAAGASAAAIVGQTIAAAEPFGLAVPRHQEQQGSSCQEVGLPITELLCVTCFYLSMLAETSCRLLGLLVALLSPSCRLLGLLVGLAFDPHYR